MTINNWSILLLFWTLFLGTACQEEKKEPRVCVCEFNTDGIDDYIEVSKSQTQIKSSLELDLKTAVKKVIKLKANQGIKADYNNIQMETVIKEVINSNRFVEYEGTIFRLKLMILFYNEYCEIICTDKRISETEYIDLRTKKLDVYYYEIISYINEIDEERKKEEKEKYDTYEEPIEARIIFTGSEIFQEPDRNSEILELPLKGDLIKIIRSTKKPIPESIPHEFEDTYIEAEDFWHCIPLKNNSEGWIFGYYVEFLDSPKIEVPPMKPIKPKLTKYVVKENAYLYRNDYNDKEQGVEIPLNSRILISGKSKNKTAPYWYYGEIPSVAEMGWMHENSLDSQPNRSVNLRETDTEKQKLKDWATPKEYDQESNENAKLKDPELETVKTQNENADKQVNSQVVVEVFSGKKISHRKIIKEPRYTYTEAQTGTVVVNISINKYGNVVKANLKKGKSNIANEAAMALAESWAQEIKFSPGNNNKDSGILTFIFAKRN